MIDLAAVPPGRLPLSTKEFVMPNFGLPSARAEASRRNGAKSKGPKTAEGKARSARNALKHGLRAEKFVVLGDEDLAAFDALQAALMAELAPQGALQAVLARRIVAATWRLERAERMEAELFARNLWGTTSFGLALIRDSNGPRAFDTLLRYRGGTLAELWRALRTLKALQAEAAAQAAAHQEAAAPAVPEAPARALVLAAVTPAPAPTMREPAPALTARPDEPERRKNPCDSDRARHSERNAAPGPAPARAPEPVGARLAPSPAVGAPDGAARGPNPFLARAPEPVGERGPNPFLARAPGARAPGGEPIEPERRRNPGESVPQPAAEMAKSRRTSLLAGTALVEAGRLARVTGTSHPTPRGAKSGS
jgi:hypothetical protein